MLSYFIHNVTQLGPKYYQHKQMHAKQHEKDFNIIHLLAHIFANSCFNRLPTVAQESTLYVYAILNVV